jgi:hypothetical protein
MNRPTYKVIIAGTRKFADYTLLCSSCDRLLSQKGLTHDIIIVSGTARGADKLGERYAKERGYNVELFPADWENKGRAAGYIRNADMANNADALIAFWDGTSHGTAHMIDIARKKNLPVRVIRY